MIETSATTARPRLTAASCELLREIDIVDQHGVRRPIQIPVERPLTLYLDKRELVTLMTLGQMPELLVLGYLRNQALVDTLSQIDSISVDWQVEAAAVKTHDGSTDFEARTARRIVTTGCGQGTAFGDAMGRIDATRLPDAAHARLSRQGLQRLLEIVREQPSIHARAGSVHGCALFQGDRLLIFVEDVGRHNALDTIAGWMWWHGIDGGDKSFYTTGRLSSEMVMKAAQLGVPIVVSRNGVTAMGHALATKLGMALIGRAANKHFLCYSGFDRFDA